MLKLLGKSARYVGLTSVIGISFSLVANTAYASSLQNFVGTAYSNPADLGFFVNDWQVVGGAMWVAPQMTFTGQTTVPNPASGLLPPPYNAALTTPYGSSTSDNSFSLGYGRIAKRLSSQWVVDVDVSQPFKEQISYGAGSLARYSNAGITTSFDSKDIAPNIAYHFDGKLSDLSVGAGLDFLYANTALQQAYPSLPVFIPGRPPTIIPFGAGNDIAITNAASGWGTGWHAGAAYHLFKGTFLGLSYYSAVNPNLTGDSTFTGVPATNNLSTTLHLPPTTNFDIKQFFSKNFMIDLGVHYTQWSYLKNIILYNTAAPNPTQVGTLNYRNTWRVDLAGRYVLTDRIILKGFTAYDETPTNDVDRSIENMGGDTYMLGGALEYKLTKALSVEAQYAHIFAQNEPINNTANNGINTVGTVSAFANVVGIKFALSM